MASALKKYLLGGSLLVGIVVAALPLALDTEGHDLDDQARSQAPGSFVELTHGQVHYELAGAEDGSFVVLVHGFSVPYFVWDPTFEKLVAEGFRVLRYDLYGRGYSDRPDVAYDRKLYVGQLHDLLHALGIDSPVDLVGLSMGGPVIASFTDSYPHRVSRLIFVDPFVGPVDAGVLTVPGLGEYLAVVFVARTLPERLAEDFYSPDKVPDWEGRFRVQMRYRGFRRALLRSLREFMAEDFSVLFAEVGGLGKPTLLFWGRHDPPHLERPEGFEPELLKFLVGEGSGSSPETRSVPVP
jgi:pimeloyl-ACP methyl ester carboxylesterase